MAIDLSPYKDLRIFDITPQQVFENAVANLQAKIPEWEPREGNIEVLLLESMALEVSETIAAINRVPSAVIEVLIQLYGIDRDFGAQPHSSVTYNLADDQGHDIPAGAALRLPIPGLAAVDFFTDEALAIPAGSTSGTVAITGENFTASANGTIAGTPLEILDSIAFAENAVLASEVVDGADPETDDIWIDRAVARLQRLTDTLLLPKHFTAAALEHPLVERAHTLDNYNPAVGPSVGSNPGHVTVAVYGNNAMVGSPTKAELDDILEAQSAANLEVHVVDPTLNTQAVNVSVIRDSTSSATDVHDAIVATLQSYLSPMTWNWDTVLRRNILIPLIAGVTGVAYVDTLTTPSADVTLTGVAPLVTAGTLTVTVIN